MRLLDRYLLRELLIPLAYCLAGFVLLWVSADLFSSLRSFEEKRLVAHDIIAYYLVTAPESLVVILPIALLLALLYTLTNHARHHEITAIRAAGISMWRLCLPYLFVGLVATGVLFTINEFWAPESADAAERILMRHQPKRPGAPGPNQVALTFRNSRDGRDWQIGTYNLQTGEMLNPNVISRMPDGSHLQLKADRAVRSNEVWVFSGNVNQFFYPAETNVAVLKLHTNILAEPVFSETPEQLRSEAKVSRLRAFFEAKRADIPIADILNYLRLHPHLSRDEGAAWLYTKLQGRLAAPWTCLVVVLIAIPFGAASGRRNVFVGVASSILICFAYFVMQQVGLTLGAGGHIAPWLAAWFPNLSFGLTGLWLTTRVR